MTNETRGPYPINGAQYTLVKNWHGAWEITTVAGTSLGALRCKYLHEDAYGQRVFGWYDAGTGVLWGLTPGEAITRWLAHRATTEAA